MDIRCFYCHCKVPDWNLRSHILSRHQMKIKHVDEGIPIKTAQRKRVRIDSEEAEEKPVSNDRTAEVIGNSDSGKVKEKLREKEISENGNVLTEHNQEVGVISYDDDNLIEMSNRTDDDNGTDIALQTVSCTDLPPYRYRCLDCLETDETSNGHVCRFRGFRKFYNGSSSSIEPCFVRQMDKAIEGHSTRHIDEWLSDSDTSAKSTRWDRCTAAFVLANIRHYFLRLVHKERGFIQDLREMGHLNADYPYWKAPDVDGSREMCDSCSTTIFNLHLFCEKCGFSICATCVKEWLEKRENESLVDGNWICCPHNRLSNDEQRKHSLTEMSLAHIIPEIGSSILSTIEGMEELVRLEMAKPDLKSFTNNTTFSPQVSIAFTPNDYTYMFNDDLLVLRNSKCEQMLETFRRSWKRSLPVIVTNCHANMKQALWSPTTFMEKFRGQKIGAFVDCRTGKKVTTVSLDEFWKGFMYRCDRVSKYGKLMLLKLKDFPPQEKFSKIFAEHYKDFCAALPIPQYSHPDTGKYNLATKLPSYCLPPDLGPKMYIAYDMRHEPSKGTTNLHLDVSDAVNILVHVRIPETYEDVQFYAALQDDIVFNMGLDDNDVQRAMSNIQNVGALWTIFKPEHNKDIRAFLKELADECEDTDDPIHSQNVYLTKENLERLYRKSGIKGYTFVQMLGDAVFIPAGAAHQVQNLQCCIKIAEDFVSPEGVRQCAIMSEQFRVLSKDHENHEDKVQLPNIVVHSVREALTVLRSQD